MQLHPASFDFGGPALVHACAALAAASPTPLAVQLDHAGDDAAIDAALATGCLDGIMADGSHLELEANQAWTRAAAARAKAAGASTEAELGLLAGEEDGLSVALRDAKVRSAHRRLPSTTAHHPAV